jgi:hypothetical protein
LADKETKMPDTNNYDMDYRPESYWGCSQEGFTNIKGEVRRKVLFDAIETCDVAVLSGSLLSDELSDRERRYVGSLHPMFMGGEYLPGYRTNELEIARASLESVTWDVVSIRARLLDNGRIAYRVEDEYETKFSWLPATSAQPLTMGELISLIDSVGREGEPDAVPGLTSYFRDYNYRYDNTLESLETYVHFVHVSSLYYHELQRWYEEEAYEWYLDRFVELADDC